MNHPGTDFWPVADATTTEITAVEITTVETGPDAHPDPYQTFSYAILGQHQPVLVDGVEKCTCGTQRDHCAVISLARTVFTGSTGSTEFSGDPAAHSGTKSGTTSGAPSGFAGMAGRTPATPYKEFINKEPQKGQDSPTEATVSPAVRA